MLNHIVDVGEMVVKFKNPFSNFEINFKRKIRMIFHLNEQKHGFQTQKGYDLSIICILCNALSGALHMCNRNDKKGREKI